MDQYISAYTLGIRNMMIDFLPVPQFLFLLLITTNFSFVELLKKKTNEIVYLS